MNGEKSEIRLLLEKIYRWGALCAVVCFAVTLFWGFDFSNLTGFAVGYGYMCVSFEYFGRVCEKAVTQDKKKAVRAVRACYFIRFGGLFLLCALSMLTGLASFAGIIVPQFFPKIILTVNEFSHKKSGKG